MTLSDAIGHYLSHAAKRLELHWNRQALLPSDTATVKLPLWINLSAPTANTKKLYSYKANAMAKITSSAWIALIAGLFTLAITLTAPVHANEWRPEIRPVVLLSHTSDLFRSYADREPTHDYAGIGITLRWKHVELDATHGAQTYHCGLFRGNRCDWESGTRMMLRWYPFGIKQ